MKPKILFIQPKFAHYRYGLFDELNKILDTTFVFLDKMNSGEYNYPSKVQVGERWKVDYLNAIHSKLWTFKLLRLIRHYKPDAIICSIPGSAQSIVTALAHVFFHIPFVLFSESWNNAREKNKIWYKKIIRRWINRFVLKNASSIVSGGSNSEKYYISQGFQRECVFKAYQSVDDMAKKKDKDFIKDTEVVKILFFSRIVASKGLDVLISSFSNIQKRHSNVELHIIGDGSDRIRCEGIAASKQIENIYFYGAVDNEKAYKYFQNADIFVLPCNGYKRGEGWGLVINEAASMSLPIITTNVVGATGDLVKDRVNGYVLTPNCQEEMEQALTELVLNKDMREEMGRKSRSLFEEINDYSKAALVFKQAVLKAIDL